MSQSVAVSPVGNPVALKKLLRAMSPDNPSDALHKMVMSEESTDHYAWAHLAARAQNIRYSAVKAETFEMFGKKCNHADIKETMVAGAIATLLQLYTSKHYFEGAKQDKTSARIGGVYLLAKETSGDAVIAVKKAFGPLFVEHGINAPYLALTTEEAETPEVRAIRRPNLAGKTAEEQLVLLKSLGYFARHPKHDAEFTVIHLYRDDPSDPGRTLRAEVKFPNLRTQAKTAQGCVLTGGALMSPEKKAEREAEGNARREAAREAREKATAERAKNGGKQKASKPASDKSKDKSSKGRGGRDKK